MRQPENPTNTTPADPLSQDASSHPGGVGLTGANGGVEDDVRPRSFEDQVVQAQQQATELRKELDETRATLQHTEQLISAVELDQDIRQCLEAAGAMDVELLRPFVQAQLQTGADQHASAKQVVEALRQSRPGCFGHKTQPKALLQNMGGQVRPSSNPSHTTNQREIADVAEAAARTGRRQEVMHYMRLRRGAR